MSRKPKSKRSKKSAPPSALRRFWRLIRWPFLILLLLFVAWVVYLDIEVQRKFDGRKWAMPARVYAQPLELYQGKQLTRADLLAELKALEYHSVNYLAAPGQWRAAGSTIDIATRSFDAGGKDEAERYVRVRFQSDRIVGFEVLKGDPASLITLEPVLIGGIYPQRQEDRELIQLSDVPPLLGEALIAVEDRNYVHHFGVSPKSIARAAWVNFQSGRVVQGGSTLTQQLVKNFFLDDSRKLSRKLTEAMMSVLLEWHYSKGEILETYMNEVYLGQSGPRQIHGFGLASKHYFGSPLSSLNESQLALLVGLVKGASYYNPWRHPERAKERRDLVLSVLHEQGLIDEQELKSSQRERLGVVPASQRRLRDYPAFIDMVKTQLREDYDDEALSSDGLKIYTTLSLAAQRQAEKSLSQRLDALEKRYGVDNGTLQGAVIMTSVGSGEVKAVVGDRNPKFAGFNRALDATRPIGSLAKPAVYLTALKKGQPYNLASTISDGPVSVAGPNDDVWQPKNFERESHGDVMLIDALSRSYNQATARLGMTVGLDNVAETFEQLGVKKQIPQVPSMLLGTMELSPAEVSEMYHTLANDGVVMPLRAIRSVEDAKGERLNRYPLQLGNPVESAAVQLVQFAMQSVMEEGTGRSAYQRLPRSLALAGKTGTTNDQRDSWFAGFSGRDLAVVWVGRDDNGATPLTGGTGALQIWTDIFSHLPTESLDIFASPDIEYLWVDGKNGRLSSENCRGSRLIPFTREQRPEEHAACDWVENPVLHWMKKWF
ncbi:penicillin-binding protein 1B [Pseudomaricurvus sp.]|uniref:penicillin-binding protein 1B n=1 Tax=Pseudomaricurvus sp. TaxID=2004510 RepID=UPI003F6BFE95